jgi:hypothetical protein
VKDFDDPSGKSQVSRIQAVDTMRERERLCQGTIILDSLIIRTLKVDHLTLYIHPPDTVGVAEKRRAVAIDFFPHLSFLSLCHTRR